MEKNDFGEVEKEYDIIHRGFGLKQSIVGLVDILSFKFDGVTEYLNNEYKVVKKANQKTCKIFSCSTNELVKEEQLAENQVGDYYLIEFSNSSRSKKDIHLEEHTFIDVIGTIYIIDIPEGIYNGEDIRQFFSLS